MKNRSVPDATVIPVLGYDDVAKAAGWLCEAFGSPCGYGSRITACSSCAATAP